MELDTLRPERTILLPYARALKEFLGKINLLKRQDRESDTDLATVFLLVKIALAQLEDAPTGGFEEVLIEELGRDNFVPHGDHKHWVLQQEGEPGKGSLVAVSQIERHSHPCPELHTHPPGLEELIIPLSVGLVSLTSSTDNGSRLNRYQIPKLACYTVPGDKFHSVFNCNPIAPVTYLTIRRTLK